jgi:hypothetical protein
VRKRCPHCKKLFIPDPRLKGKQKTCGGTECQKARRRENAKKWRSKNPDYDDRSYREVRFRTQRFWKRQYWATHPEYRKHHAEYMRQWRGMKKLPDSFVRVPYREIELTCCKQTTFLDITSVRVPYRVIESNLLNLKENISILQL